MARRHRLLFSYLTRYVHPITAESIYLHRRGQKHQGSSSFYSLSMKWAVFFSSSSAQSVYHPPLNMHRWQTPSAVPFSMLPSWSSDVYLTNWPTPCHITLLVSVVFIADRKKERKTPLVNLSFFIIVPLHSAFNF